MIEFTHKQLLTDNNVNHQELKEKKIHISTFLKFAIAACIFGVVFYIGKVFYNENKQSSVALTEKPANASESAPFDNAKIKERKFSSIKSTTTSIEAIEQTGIGFGPTSKKIYTDKSGYKLLNYNGKYYLHYGNLFYELKRSKSPKTLLELNDGRMYDILTKIVFENE
jgi:hypothetical protein